ncbi:hypothetical protein [Acetobacter sp. DsW_059]|uniref:hypothetical protein n=1 Tax=Acetobacter sp. DsW_059 TaxID=1670661 RepID=UPI000A3AA3CF|nr:hypothetical protein [Acetobacter sp. DsW_059]OUJ11666.1 hypothetical protein HK25_13340 [Acetobacter sp. DsW_059]
MNRVEAYRFDSKQECLDYLDDLFKTDKYRNLDEVKVRASMYAKHDKELHDFFIDKGKELLARTP